MGKNILKKAPSHLFVKANNKWMQPLPVLIASHIKYIGKGG